MLSEGADLQDELNEEDENEGELEPVQDLIHLVALIVRLHRQNNHVQADNPHYEEFKVPTGHQVKQPSPGPILSVMKSSVKLTFL